jgi:hypothetical protein
VFTYASVFPPASFDTGEVLRATTHAQIVAAVVEAAPVTVIDVEAVGRLHNQSVHEQIATRRPVDIGPSVRRKPLVFNAPVIGLDEV